MFLLRSSSRKFSVPTNSSQNSWAYFAAVEDLGEDVSHSRFRTNRRKSFSLRNLRSLVCSYAY